MDNIQIRKLNIDDDSKCLDFVQVGERAHMLFNKRTGRFHNAELGIDFLPMQKVEILADGDAQ